jgi:branched-chain amino acid transport system substrate-binding protein
MNNILKSILTGTALVALSSGVALGQGAEAFSYGVPIEIVVADHQNRAGIAANLTRQWLDRYQVDVVADVPISAAALAVQEVTREKGGIFLMSGPGSQAYLTTEASGRKLASK